MRLIAGDASTPYLEANEMRNAPVPSLIDAADSKVSIASAIPMLESFSRAADCNGLMPRF